MPTSHNVRFTYESASVMLYIWPDNTAAVGNLFARQRRQGHATKLMEQVLSYADHNQLGLILDAKAYGRPIGPDNKILVEFYQKFGFELIRPYSPEKRMWRPSQDLHAL